MEKSEFNENNTIEAKELVFDSKIENSLTTTRKWTMFFSVLGFIAIGFLVLAAVTMLIMAFVGSGFMGNQNSLIFGGLTVIYLAVGLLYFFPVFYLLKFSAYIKSAFEKTEQNKLVEAFEYLKSHYKFVGILTIVIIGLYVLLGIIAAMVGISSLF